MKKYTVKAEVPMTEMKCCCCCRSPYSSGKE